MEKFLKGHILATPGPIELRFGTPIKGDQMIVCLKFQVYNGRK